MSFFSDGPMTFENAPVTKVAVMVVFFFSALLGWGRWGLISQRLYQILNYHSVTSFLGPHVQFWRPFTSQFFFATFEEMLFGLLLLYCFRSFERRYGSSKFMGAVIVWMVSYSMVQTGLLIMAQDFLKGVSGPYSLVGALLLLQMRRWTMLAPMVIIDLNIAVFLTQVRSLTCRLFNFLLSLVGSSHQCQGSLYDIENQSRPDQWNARDSPFVLSLTDRHFFLIFVLQFAICGGWPAVGGLCSGMVAGWLWQFDMCQMQRMMIRLVKAFQPADTANFCYFLVQFPFCCCYAHQMPQWAQSPVDQLRFHHQQQILLARSRAQMEEQAIRPPVDDDDDGGFVAARPFADEENDPAAQMQMHMLRFIEQQQRMAQEQQARQREAEAAAGSGARSGSGGEGVVDPATLQRIVEIGFSPAAAADALRATRGNASEAINLLLNEGFPV